MTALALLGCVEDGEDMVSALIATSRVGRSPKRTCAFQLASRSVGVGLHAAVSGLEYGEEAEGCESDGDGGE